MAYHTDGMRDDQIFTDGWLGGLPVGPPFAHSCRLQPSSSVWLLREPGNP